MSEPVDQSGVAQSDAAKADVTTEENQPTGQESQENSPQKSRLAVLFSPTNRLYWAWVIALVATLGSLYFSEIKYFRPCPLCWLQRIFMYPLVIMLGIAAWQMDLRIRIHVISLSVIGAVIALVQNLETWGIIPKIKACTMDMSASCGTPWPIWGTSDFAKELNNIITIPVLSMIAFIMIIALLSWPKQDHRESETA